VQDVPLSEDPRAGPVGVEHHRGAHVALGHLLGGLAQRMARTDGQHHLAHRVTHLHERITPTM
jgi:hypothetical protein